ncbi:hypothetical protein [Methylorubrum extorquens]|uniref:Transcriptional regulator n=1 Tax=Methylorubrum extorquens (strain ATCC 14718 / DSM 1338 / JCM 2805 / NCIMB 9133 / AM1) TaxID=272630 RepID=C5B662_METEA|nr:hypothetical protein [Methylorubrum extorquens]ACS43944.1 conserved hypothetical protein [Methylorubrum extorquens AM1]MCP1546203.1 hypothetical protein [Methylorubrum extorquens]MCP1590870.1 hypothetical protein [Methylorubrum extorquens]
MARRPLHDEDVRRCLAAAVDLAGGQSAWAARHGLTQSYVAKLVLGRREISSPRVLSALGLRELPRAYEPTEPRP